MPLRSCPWPRLSVIFCRCRTALRLSAGACRRSYNRRRAALLRRVVPAVGFGIALAPHAVQADLFQAPLGPNGSWNVYETSQVASSWAQANELDPFFHDTPGHLVTISSAAEQNFLEYLLAQMNFNAAWIGLTDREGAALPGTSASGTATPQESSTMNDPRHEGWGWVTGEPLIHTYWQHDVPANSSGATDAVYMNRFGRWKDDRSGYAADSPIVPVLQPGSSPSEPSIGPLAYILEYETQATQPYADIQVVSPPPKMPTSLPGLNGSDGYLGITSFFDPSKNITQLHQVSEWITRIDNGLEPNVEVDSLRVPWADVIEPTQTANSGPIVTSIPFSLPGAAPVSEASTVYVAKGRIFVPVTGDYTFQVRGRSAFVLQVGDQEFQSSAGIGSIDPFDSHSLISAAFDRDANTRGVLTLEAGEHEIRFISSSNTSELAWEITTAQGAVESPFSAQWIALGDGSSRAERTQTAIAKLLRPAQVTNIPELIAGRPRNVADAAAAIEIGLEDGVFFYRDDVDTLILRESGYACCYRPVVDISEDAPTYLWPINDEEYGGSKHQVDYFASLIEAGFTIDDGDETPNETMVVTFAMFANEGAQLHIRGASFFERAGTKFTLVGDDVALLDDGIRGNTEAYGVIELTEGVEYDLEAITFEQTQDSGFELWVAAGDHHETKLHHEAFMPLSFSNTQVIFPANEGLRFVAATDPGDYDGNGQLNVDDLAFLARAILHQDLSFDLDENQMVDNRDRIHWVKEIKQTWVGDANLDGEFNAADLVQLFAAGAYETETAADWTTGDWNGDGRFTSSDLVSALIDGGYEQGPRTVHQSVPEPTQSSSFAVVILWVLARAGRKRQSICDGPLEA